MMSGLHHYDLKNSSLAQHMDGEGKNIQFIKLCKQDNRHSLLWAKKYTEKEESTDAR